MKLYVIRHSDAGESLHAPGTPDPDPPLLPDGRALAAAMAAEMRRMGAIPTRVIASPLKRAKQTAEAVRAEFKLPPVEIEDGLGPTHHRGSSMAVVVKKIAGNEDMKRVAIVSHHDMIHAGLQALNFADSADIDPIAKGELRVLDIDRDTGMWEELDRRLPSDVGFADVYGNGDASS